MSNKLFKVFFGFVLITGLLVGLTFRLWNIDFGLPHSFYADEPEIGEPAITYAYNLKDIVLNNNYYKLIPISYVYGTVPAYIFTVVLLIATKLMNIFGLTAIDKYHVYTALRIVNALGSMVLPLLGYFLYKKIFKSPDTSTDVNNKNSALGSLITLVLLALNWKLVVHAHYLNADILLTTFLLMSLISYAEYIEKPTNTNVVMCAIAYGLAVGTKITALITLPLYAIYFIKKRDYKDFVMFCFLVAGMFIITNPFSIIFINDFAFRVLFMSSREAGLVFDSVNTNVFKYIPAIADIMSLPVTVMAAFAIGYGLIKDRFKLVERAVGSTNKFFIITLLICVTYIGFYTVQPRRVDRWMLPIIPIIAVYAAHALVQVISLAQSSCKNSVCKGIVIFIILVTTGYFYTQNTLLLTQQFNRHTPRSEAYLWIRNNIRSARNFLVYTEEGLDPMKKIPFSNVTKVPVYEYEGAGYFRPEDISKYPYIVISSRPLNYYKNSEVKKHYPEYSKAWEKFEKELTTSSQYERVKDFVLPKPNLVPLSDIYIYKNTQYKEPESFVFYN